MEARPGWRPVDLKELWEYRDLLWFLAMRDVKVRYKQTVLGVAWAVIQPVFRWSSSTSSSAGSGSWARTDVPYFPSSLAGLVPWSSSPTRCTNASNSLVAEQQLITKVYFPRLIVPLAAVLGGLVDFAIALALLLVMMPFFGVYPTWQVVTLPLFVLLAVVAALAVGLWLSALNVQYRDVRYTLPFLDADLAVPDAGRVPEQHGARGVAAAVRAEPDGRRGRGLPLGAARRHAAAAGADAVRSRRR